MFGNNKPFGTATTFGASTFGSSTTPFGQTSTAFGARPATGNVFGGSTFGASAPSTSGLFGTAAPSTGTGLFGQTTTAFGQPASTSGGSFVFGSTANQGNLFGTTAPATQTAGLFGGSSTSAFGSPRPTFGGFGGTSTGTSLFGQNTSTSTGLFGASTAFSAAPNGTTVKFNPPTGTDTMMKGGVSQNINTRHQCITCMKEYENKSLEELRLEDYSANRKGPQAGVGAFGGQTGQTGLFGAPAASTSAFSFGTTQAKPLFGTTTGTTSFGTTGTGLFGQTTQPQNTGIFGKPVGFGTSTTTSTPAFAFGGTTGTSVFGQANQQKPLFGQPATGTGLFGQSATTQPSTGFGTATGFGGFGATSQPSTGLFGAKPTGFGTTSTATTNTFSFGNTANTGGLFGQKPTTQGFGTGTGFGTGFGTFGNTQTTGTGLFGQNKQTTTGFGTGFGSGLGTGFGTSGFSNLGMNTSTGTGLFGSSLTTKPTGFSFGGTGTGFGGFGQPATGSAFNFGSTPAVGMGSDPNAANLLHQQLQAQQVAALTTNPFGDNPLFRNVLKNSRKREELLKPTNPAAQKAVLTNSRYKVSPLPSTKIKPKPITPISNGKVSLFDGLEDEEPSLSNATFIPKRSVKKLVMKQAGSVTSSFVVTSNIISSSSHPTEINFTTSVLLERTPPKVSRSQGDSSPLTSPLTVEISNRTPVLGIEDSNNPESPVSSPVLQDSLYINESLPDIPPRTSSNTSLNDTIEALHIKGARQSAKAFDVHESDSRQSEKGLSEPLISSSTDVVEDGNVSSVYEKRHPTGISLKRPGYYTVPSLEELIPLMDDNGNCFVADFIIGHEVYGKVCFPGLTNVAGLDLDEIVHFKKKEITIYPGDRNKPPVGEGLNRKAEITLESIWPTDKTTHSPIKDPDRLSVLGFREKIERSTARLDATFIDYKPETGSWIFEVEHFSKYGLEDSDDDELDDPKLAQQTKLKAKELQKKLPPTNGETSAKTDNQVQMSKKMRVTTDDDDEMQDADVSDSENFFSPLQQMVSPGMDSERIQGMKASFFLDEAEDNWEMSEVHMHEPIPHFGATKNSDLFVKPVPIRKPFESSSFDFVKKSGIGFGEPRAFKPPSSMSATFDEQVSEKFSKSAVPPITPAREEIWSAFPMLSPLTVPCIETSVPQKNLMGNGHKITLRPFKKSLVYNKQELLADIGFFMGRSFRVGWNTGGTLLHLGHVQGYSPNRKAGLDSSLYTPFTASTDIQEKPFSVSISKVQVLADVNVDNIVKENVVQALEVQLENSALAIEDGSPLFVPKHGIQLLHAHANLSEKQLLEIGSSHSDSPFIKQCNHVWELCVSLWGEVPGLESDQNASSYAQQMARREALSSWLIKTCKEKIQSELNNSSFDSSKYLFSIFSHLTGRQISKAVLLAQESNDRGLSTLLAQAEGNSVCRQLIAKQLNNWEQSGAYKLINTQRLKLYSLLAGSMVWKMPNLTINCCENLDWRRALALHLWYYCYPTSSIKEAVTEFEKSFAHQDAEPPYPPYMQNDISEETTKSHSLYDTCFHILKLYCDRTHRLEKLLLPEASTPAHLDHRLSWMLHQSLIATGYSQLSPHLSCALSLNLASQLEAMNLWHWAVFVLLHISDPKRRKIYVKDLLLRHVSLEQSQENEEREQFLCEKLLVPHDWIFEAKAIKAHSFGQPADEAWYLLKAEQWSKSHEIVISCLASDAVINENYDYLLKFLNELAPSERSSTIHEWQSGGQVFLDYIHISQMVESVVKGEVSAYDVEKLQPEVLSLCYRLSSIHCPTAKDRLCQSEMAKKTATLLRAVLILQAERSGCLPSTYTLTPHIKNLPMPEDYALQELQALAHNYLLAVTSE